MRLVIRRPSPAMVVACLALLVALGGTSVAAVQQLGRNTVGTAQIRNNAVTTPKIANNAVTAAKIRDNAVVRRKIANNAVSSAQVQTGSLLATDFAEGQIPEGPAGPAGPAGPQGPAGVVTRLTAVVNSSGALARSQGTTSAGRLSEGSYEVVFNQNISACTYVASPGSPTGSPLPVGQIAVGTQTANSVLVRTRDSAGVLADLSFHLIVVC